MGNKLFVFPGLDWKVFTSSCLPKKFREDVTFGGTTYKVSGIPDGEIKALWGFDWLPSALETTISAFLSFLWSTIEYSMIQPHMRTFVRWSSCNLGAKRMFCHSLSLFSLLNNYTALNLVFKRKENCQLTSQIRQSLPYHSQVAKRCWACPWVVIFFV